MMVSEDTIGSLPPASPRFTATLPIRGATDDYVRVLYRTGRLRHIWYGTRRGPCGIPAELTSLLPAFGGIAYLGGKLLHGQNAESLRFRLHPWLDGWARRQMQRGDHIISSYGYANACFAFSRATGGKTFLDAGNSHPANFWEIVSEEHRRWNCPLPPISQFQHCRAMAMMESVDYVLAPSSFVANSFLQRGFSPERVLSTFYPVDLSLFIPAPEPRPSHRPLTIISTAPLSLRKGSPYLLEAFRIVHRRHPSARLFLTSGVHQSMREIIKRYAGLPIDWSPPLPHSQLAARLRSADIFVLPSIEEGLVRTALEAMACGLPVVLTPHTGTNDYVRSDEAGEVVPIRDAAAIAQAIIKIGDRIMKNPESPRRRFDPDLLSFHCFQQNFTRHLERIGI